MAEAPTSLRAILLPRRSPYRVTALTYAALSPYYDYHLSFSADDHLPRYPHLPLPKYLPLLTPSQLGDWANLDTQPRFPSLHFPVYLTPAGSTSASLPRPSFVFSALVGILPLSGRHILH